MREDATARSFKGVAPVDRNNDVGYERSLIFPGLSSQSGLELGLGSVEKLTRESSHGCMRRFVIPLSSLIRPSPPNYTRFNASFLRNMATESTGTHKDPVTGEMISKTLV